MASAEETAEKLADRIAGIVGDAASLRNLSPGECAALLDALCQYVAVFGADADDEPGGESGESDTRPAAGPRVRRRVRFN